MTRALVLLSAGRNPVTGYPRRACHDAAALELAMRIPDCTIAAVHADAEGTDEEALREYLGMGLPRIGRINLRFHADVATALLRHIREHAPDIVLAGICGARDGATGLLPYRLAAGLNWSIVAGIRHVARIERGRICIEQALTATQIRTLECELPLVLTVSAARTQPRAVAYGPARRGLIVDMPARTLANGPTVPELQPATLPNAPIAESRRAADRIAQFRGESKTSGRLLIDPEPHDAAEALLSFLAQTGFVPEENRRVE